MERFREPEDSIKPLAPTWRNASWHYVRTDCADCALRDIVHDASAAIDNGVLPAEAAVALIHL